MWHWWTNTMLVQVYCSLSVFSFSVNSIHSAITITTSSTIRTNSICVFVSPSGFFIRPFYKMMLGKQISLKDMESVVSFHFFEVLNVRAVLWHLFCTRQDFASHWIVHFIILYRTFDHTSLYIWSHIPVHFNHALYCTFYPTSHCTFYCTLCLTFHHILNVHWMVLYIVQYHTSMSLCLLKTCVQSRLLSNACDNTYCMAWATGVRTDSDGVDAAPPTGQWILQLLEVDPGERPHGAGPAVLHRRG